MAKRLYRGGEDARRSNPIYSGLMIGVLVGLIFAIGVALWVRSSNPFKSPDPIPQAATTGSPQSAPPEPEPAPNYDFYKVLPGDTPTAPPEAEPVIVPNPPRYYLQAGAFQDADDADNLKAELALLGIEAQIQTGVVADQGVLHRVRIGPFTAMDAVNSTRSVLMQNNIEADLVKESPTPSETP